MLDGISIKTPYVFSYSVTVVTYAKALAVTWKREEKCLFIELLCCLNLRAITIGTPNHTEKRIFRRNMKRTGALSCLCTWKNLVLFCIGQSVTMIHMEQILQESRSQLKFAVLLWECPDTRMYWTFTGHSGNNRLGSVLEVCVGDAIHFLHYVAVTFLFAFVIAACSDQLKQQHCDCSNCWVNTAFLWESNNL